MSISKVAHISRVVPPAPPRPTQPKLIPLVSTDRTLDPQMIAQLYTARWPCQENIIKGWLLPLGIDVNHGVRKTPIPNSEVAKQRAELEQRDRTLCQRVAGARQHLQTAIARKVRRQERQQRQQAGLAREPGVVTGHASRTSAGAGTKRWPRRRTNWRRIAGSSAPSAASWPI